MCNMHPKFALKLLLRVSSPQVQISDKMKSVNSSSNAYVYQINHHHSQAIFALVIGGLSDNKVRAPRSLGSIQVQGLVSSIGKGADCR